MRRKAFLAACCALVIFVTGRASALDKQGSAHGGDVGEKDGHENDANVSGALTMGVSLINSTYAARPDNTGIALMRYAGHADIDVIGRKLSFPIDVNMFSDRERKGGLVFAPSELDGIGGVTTTFTVTTGADMELGLRVEHDRPVDRGKFSQTYVDTRARLLYSLAKVWPSLARDLVDGDISGYATAGWFILNPTYAARPDNSGSALFRYVAHTELSVWKDHLSLGLDGTFFTDRREIPASAAVRPSELDVTYEVILRRDPFEVHVAYERDMPIDQTGLIQSFMYALLVWDFDLSSKPMEPLESRGSVLSP